MPEKKKKAEVAGVTPKGLHQDAKFVTYSDA
jgi:hypothetical protein